MDNKEYSSSVPSSDEAAVLRARQVTILAEIDALTQTESNHIPFNRRTIASLKQYYNEIVEKRAKMERGPLADPLRTLPPELWPNIFREVVLGLSYPVDTLLDLTLVSQVWSAALISLTELWTRIHLDSSKEDYLAKAVIGIQFSGGREIELYIGRLTLDEWRTISSMIRPASGRFRYLSFACAELLPPPGELEILKDLPDLSVLQDLLLYNTRRMPQTSESYLKGVEMKKMPSLKTIGGIQFRDQSTWNQFIVRHELSVSTLQQEHIDALACCPRLKIFWVDQLTAYQGEAQNHLCKSASTLMSIETFSCFGHNLLHSLKWIGDGLTNLSFTPPRNTGFGGVLLAISRFPHLLVLTIRTGTPFGIITTENTSPTVEFELPVKTIVLLNFSGEESRAGWDHIVRALMPVSPWVEHLSMFYITLTDFMLADISARKTLATLQMSSCQIDMAEYPLSLDTTTIGDLRWSGYADDTEKAFTIVRSLGPRTLEFRIIGRTSQNESGEKVLELKHFVLPSHAFPTVISLIISAASLAIWDLGSFPMLRELEIAHTIDTRPEINWDNDVLDAILLRPRDTPALEKITIKGNFYEWDLLILMLERKNFLVEPGIAHIKTIVVDKELPYKLLYPLSELVGGNFVERDSNVSFSIEPIGQRIWNKSL
jgi:hypothetical protein